jgi:hypothetical protein
LLETVADLSILHVDIDFRSVAATPDEVDDVLRTLPLRPEIRDSGGGRHVIFHLKESAAAGTPEFERVNAVRARLTAILGGDRTPDHAAALLREAGRTIASTATRASAKLSRMASPSISPTSRTWRIFWKGTC